MSSLGRVCERKVRGPLQEILFVSNKTDRIDQNANASHFVWTSARVGAYSSVPKCISSLGSHAREVVLSSGIPNELRWLAKQIRPFVPWHVASFLCMTAGSLLALLTPLVLKWLIDQVLPRRESGLLLAAGGLIFLSYQGR